MSEREDVLLTALDEAVEAREGTYFQLDYPTERDHAIKQYAEAREAIRRALTPAPRVVVLEAMTKAREALLVSADLLRHAISSEDGVDAAEATVGIDAALDAIRLLESAGSSDPHHAALTEAPADGA